MRLSDEFRSGNPDAVRKCPRESVHRADLWTTEEKRGRRHFYHLDRSVVELCKLTGHPAATYHCQSKTQRLLPR